MHFLLFLFGNCVYKATPELLDEEIIKQIKIYASKSTGYFTEEKRYSLNMFKLRSAEGSLAGFLY